MKHYKPFFALLFISIIAFISSCDSTVESRNWYNKFFTEAVNDDDGGSRRMFMVWFGGDRQGFSKDIWIGGNQRESERWFGLVDILLTGQRDANPKNSPFLLELVCDQITLATQSDGLHDLTKRFPDTFRVTLVDSIEPNRLPPHDVLEHAHTGNPVIASDALRLWYLHDTAYANNIYIDVDTFLDKADNLYRYSDHKTFGREVPPNGLYFPERNNDYLIDRNVEEKKIENIKRRGEVNFNDNAKLLSHFKHRANFALNPSAKLAFTTYLDALNKQVSYQIDNGDKRINLAGTIISTFGPGLWVSSSHGDAPDATENTALQEAVVSAQAWKDGRSVPVGEQSLTANKLSTINIVKDFVAKADQADTKRFKEIILSLNLMGWDHNYFSRFPHKDLAELVGKKIHDLWREAQDLLAKNVPNASSTDLAKELKSATGGLYYSFMAMDN